MSLRWPCGRALAITAATLVPAGVAQAKLTNSTVVLGGSIGAVSVGMTRTQVETLLGPGLLVGDKGARVELVEEHESERA